MRFRTRRRRTTAQVGREEESGRGWWEAIRRKIKTRQTGRQEVVAAVAPAKRGSLHGGGETEPIKGGNRVAGRRRRQQAELRQRGGIPSRRRRRACACTFVSHDHAHTNGPANSIHRPPPALSSLLIKSPLCWQDAMASNCVAVASRVSTPPPPPPCLHLKPSPASQTHHLAALYLN